MTGEKVSLPTEVRAWAHDIADKFRKRQAKDPLSFSLNGQVVRPEEQLVEFVIRALAEGGCPATAAVLEEVDRIRASAPVEEAA